MDVFKRHYLLSLTSIGCICVAAGMATGHALVPLFNRWAVFCSSEGSVVYDVADPRRGSGLFIYGAAGIVAAFAVGV